MESKNLYIVAGSSGLIGSSICDIFQDSKENYIGLDFKSGRHSTIIDLSNQKEFIKNVGNKIDHGITDISLVYSAGKNGSVESGGLDRYGDYSEKDLNQYLYQNAIVPYACSMSLISLAREKNLNLKILILCSHYSFVAGTDSLYSLNDLGEKQIKPHGYIISKHAAIGVVKSLASTYGSDQILINGFAPGGILNNQDKNFVKKFQDYSSLKRLANPSEIAKWIVTLANPELTYANGSIFNVDGGVLIK
tara:strand:- start:695 stop:1441 length:747 start_codon:yes stop_codon:yes gene_type:complete